MARTACGRCGPRASVLAATVLLAACGSPATPATESGPAFGSCGATVAELTASARAEDGLTLIGVPDAWANYGVIVSGFERTYGIPVTQLYPEASSADELTVVRTWGGDPRRPDVLEVGPAEIVTAIDEGLLDPFRPTASPAIAAALKDPDGSWVATYFGLLGFGVNRALVEQVPASWADLRRPEYRGMVALSGDPRESGTGLAAVIAAALANGGSFDDVMPGIEYFADLKRSGNLRSGQTTDNDLKYGDVSIDLDWMFNFADRAAQLATSGADYAAVVPEDGVYGSFYAQAVVAGAQHPCAARLWLEYLLGDQASLLRAMSGAVPVRFAEMLRAGKVPAAISAGIPPGDEIEDIAFPTARQLAAMKEQVAEHWGPMVADASAP